MEIQQQVYNFDDIKIEIQRSIDEHSKYGGQDGTVYNLISIITIALTSTATILPVDSIYLRVISGIATFFIAANRAMNFGGRWIYHRQMRQEYLIIMAKISFFKNMELNFAPEKKQSFCDEIYTDLYNIRRKEDKMPGVITQ